MAPMGATSSGRPCVACLMQQQSQAQQQTPWAACAGACGGAGAKGLSPAALHSHSSLLHMQHMLSAGLPAAGLLTGALTLLYTLQSPLSPTHMHFTARCSLFTAH